jgi:uncharacterized membrane protein YphA (DoxX/SURF4 family)
MPTCEFRHVADHFGSSVVLAVDAVLEAILYYTRHCAFGQCRQVYMWSVGCVVLVIDGQLPRYVALVLMIVCAVAASIDRIPGRAVYSTNWPWTRIVWLVCFIGTTLYNYTWDLFMDWGLGRIYSDNFMLRDKLVWQNQKWVCQATTRSRLGWVGLDWIGLDWIGLDCTDWLIR